MGTLTVEEIYQVQSHYFFLNIFLNYETNFFFFFKKQKDRKKFAIGVREVAVADFANLGLEIVSYTIKDVKDDEGYLEALGRKRTAEVKRDARIGEAEANRDAGIRVNIIMIFFSL